MRGIYFFLEFISQFEKSCEFSAAFIASIHRMSHWSAIETICTRPKASESIPTLLGGWFGLPFPWQSAFCPMNTFSRWVEPVVVESGRSVAVSSKLFAVAWKAASAAGNVRLGKSRFVWAGLENGTVHRGRSTGIPASSRLLQRTLKELEVGSLLCTEWPAVQIANMG